MKLGVPQEIAIANAVQQVNSWCEVCGSSEHAIDACVVNPYFVNYVGNENHPGQQNFGNTYNPNWRNHPNFSWGENQAQNNN